MPPSPTFTINGATCVYSARNMLRRYFCVRNVAPLLIALMAAFAPRGIVAGEGAASPSPAASSSPGPSAPPRVIPQRNVEYYALDPFRPPDARVLRLTIGKFDSYVFWGEDITAQFLRLRDSRTGATTDFLLSTDTTLNGKPLPCSATRNVGGEKFCESIPDNTFPRGADVALLYWSAVFEGGGGTYNATDTIATMPAAQDRKRLP